MKLDIYKIISRLYIDEETHKAEAGKFIVAGRLPNGKFFFHKLDKNYWVTTNEVYVQAKCDYGHFMYMKRY